MSVTAGSRRSVTAACRRWCRWAKARALSSRMSAQPERVTMLLLASVVAYSSAIMPQPMSAVRTGRIRLRIG